MDAQFYNSIFYLLNLIPTIDKDTDRGEDEIPDLKDGWNNDGVIWEYGNCKCRMLSTCLSATMTTARDLK